MDYLSASSISGLPLSVYTERSQTKGFEMPFYKKIKPIPKFAEEPLYQIWLKTFKKEGTEAAFYALTDSFPALAGLPLNEWMPSLKSEAPKFIARVIR